ncbi:MAG: universal stress protein [Candidatus Bathyarchaeia archaeon]
MVIRNILVAVDGSENSDRALDFALDLAVKFYASILILNVSESLVMGAVSGESIAYSGGNTSVFGKDLSKIHDEILSRSVAMRKQLSLIWRFRRC